MSRLISSSHDEFQPNQPFTPLPPSHLLLPCSILLAMLVGGYWHLVRTEAEFRFSCEENVIIFFFPPFLCSSPAGSASQPDARRCRRGR